jgi:nucleotide-binding universal stress UspA family protein
MTMQGTIVVGVDGSDCSRAALEFALDEGVRRDAAVRVVWAVPEAEYWPTAYGMSPSLLKELCAAAEKSEREMVDAVVRERGGAVADVPVEVSALGGPAAQVLMAQSRDADLLVIGHRGRGALRSAVLGSVGLACVLHSMVPVTVVRTASQPATPADDRDAIRART